MDGLIQTNKKMAEKYDKYYNSVSKTYEFELKKDYNRNGKILNSGVKIPTTQEGIDWFLENGYGEPEKKKVKKETKTKKAQEEQK
tara:strand:+ start:230 stop:484 length:255 start_codon:yes stop_codon:yes gene_type:complete